MTYDRTSSLEGALRLHYNENTAGCSSAVMAALRSMRCEDLAIYPETTGINARVEAWYGVGAGWVQVTNGLDEGIQIVSQCGAWHYGARVITPEVIVVDPAFEVYEACAEAIGARLVRIPPEPEFRFPLERLLASTTPATRVIYLTDPNNPTGLGIPAGAVETIAAATPQALILVDEAYSDFSGRTLIGPLLERHPNVVVGRTFAKAHGLAALRVGAVVAEPTTIALLRRVLLPFSVNVCAITALDTALADRPYLNWYVAEVTASRRAVYEFCDRHHLKYWPSEANFVLIRVGDTAGSITAALARQRILVRDKSAAPGCAGCIRLTTGVLEHTRLALSALEELLAPRTH